MNNLVENKIELSSIKYKFDEIYLSNYARLCRFAQSFVKDREESENIVQDVFMILWEKREVLDVQIALQAWLFTMTKNKCLDYFKHQEVLDSYKSEHLYLVKALEQMDCDFSSEEDLEEIINQGLAELPERCREVFMMSRFDGKKYKDIAKEMNISVNTVENQMSVALRKLRIIFKEYLPLLIFLIS